MRSLQPTAFSWLIALVLPLLQCYEISSLFFSPDAADILGTAKTQITPNSFRDWTEVNRLQEAPVCVWGGATLYHKGEGDIESLMARWVFLEPKL